MENRLRSRPAAALTATPTSATPPAPRRRADRRNDVKVSRFQAGHLHFVPVGCDARAVAGPGQDRSCLPEGRRDLALPWRTGMRRGQRGSLGGVLETDDDQVA